MPTIRYFAAAAAAAGTASEVRGEHTLGALRAALIAEHGAEFERILDRCSVLVDGRSDTPLDSALGESATVDVLPPFAGG